MIKFYLRLGSPWILSRKRLHCITKYWIVPPCMIPHSRGICRWLRFTHWPVKLILTQIVLHRREHAHHHYWIHHRLLENCWIIMMKHALRLAEETIWVRAAWGPSEKLITVWCTILVLWT